MNALADGASCKETAMNAIDAKTNQSKETAMNKETATKEDKMTTANANQSANDAKTKKIITIYNIKGGVGKSTIARELAYKLDATLVDCDKGGAQEYMESLKVVKAVDNIPSDDDIDAEVVIYDFPGQHDKRRDAILDESALVIVPYTPTLYSLQNTIDSFAQVWKTNHNVIMVANMLKEDKDLNRSKDELEETLNQFDSDIGEILVLPLHYTRGLQSAENKGRTIYNLRKESAINRLNYEKVCREFDAIADATRRIIYDETA
jgi:chromosome partitioning protein